MLQKTRTETNVGRIGMKQEFQNGETNKEQNIQTENQLYWK